MNLSQKDFSSKQEWQNFGVDLFTERSTKLQGIRNNLQLPHQGLLYYPACGRDNSPDSAFQGWEIYYMDAVDSGIKTSCEGKFIKGDLMFPPFEITNVKFDVALLISPGNHFDQYTPAYIQQVTKYVRIGGYIICDDYHQTASDIRHYLQYELKEVAIGETESEFTAFIKLVGDEGLEPPTLSV